MMSQKSDFAKRLGNCKCLQSYTVCVSAVPLFASNNLHRVCPTSLVSLQRRQQLQLPKQKAFSEATVTIFRNTQQP